MKKDLIFGEQEQAPFNNALESVLRKGARELLQQAIEAEVAAYIDNHAQEKDEQGRRLVTRNGRLPERPIQTGIGQILVEQPRVRDKREKMRFISKIIPPYARRAPSIETVIPTLYLKGISTGDFQEALEALLGENAKGLSATNDLSA